MNNNWWRNFDQLDNKQQAFVMMPKDGKYSLEGPPGSGKTNLLLLRAQYIAGGGDKNVLIITFTKTLRNFIRSGIGAKGLIGPSQIQTYHSWAGRHVTEHLGFNKGIGGGEFNDETRTKLLELVHSVNGKLPSTRLYDVIFVDEVQDLMTEELEVLLCLSERVCICGDLRQGIYEKDGLGIADKLGLAKHTLSEHFRIGHRIAQVADRLIPPASGTISLEDSSNYDAGSMGKAVARLHECASRDAQFVQMLESVRVQLDAYPEDTVGIFCAKNECAKNLRERFDQTDLAKEVVVHGLDENASFSPDARIHVMTIHSSKGTEFRSVHMYGVEDLAQYPFQRTKLAYTAVTRAKTSLNAYRTGPTSPRLESAFAEPTMVEVADLF